jgi:phosphomannomutase
MNEINIQFGTDGWRGIIAERFTFRGVKIVSRAVSNYLNKKSDGRRKPRVVLGYDTRFLSDRFARTAAGVFTMNNIETYLSERIITTPVLSYAVVNKKADLGVMITASHNPYYYNGYKIKGSFGSSATMDIIKGIEVELDEVMGNIARYEKSLNFEGEDDVDIKEFDFLSAYRENILSQIDRDIIKDLNFSLLLEPMYGASRSIFIDILRSISRANIYEMHSILNPGFGGINPEPIGDNLNEAREVLKNKDYKLAICLDGDGDRIAALGEDGNYISSHHLYSIILWYLAHVKKMKGKVVKSVNLSSTIDKICARYNLELVTTPVGFKYIVEEIMKGGVIMGGEESGGLWAGGSIPERDGMLMGLKLLEILSTLGMTVNQVLEKIYDEFGYFVFTRIDYETDLKQKKNLQSITRKGIPGVLKEAGVKNVVTLDGYKYIMEDGSWLMIRPSGTEAVVRVYAEGDSEEKTNYLHKLGGAIIDSAI